MLLHYFKCLSNVLTFSFRLTCLCGLSEDEFRVFNQTLKRHRHVNDLCPLVLPTVVCYKSSIPGIEDDET